MTLWDKLKGKVKTRIEEVKEDMEEAKEDREEFRLAKKEAYNKERLKVAVEEGKEKARKPTGMKGFMAGLDNVSKKLGEIAPAPPKEDNKNHQTMMDVKF